MMMLMLRLLGAAAGVRASGITNGGDLHFLVMADWGGQAKAPYTTKQEISTAGGMGRIAEVLNASFSLAVGDNFYSSGIRTDCTDPRFQHTFEDVFVADSLQGPRFPFYVIAGNHDHGGNVSAQIAYTQRSNRWKYPASWYNFKTDLGGGASLEIVMIDTVELAGNSDVRDGDGKIVRELGGDELPGPADKLRANAQLQWLEATLKAVRRPLRPFWRPF
jgi:tartrate-resistant acid phosphatase type 5